MSGNIHTQAGYDHIKNAERRVRRAEKLFVNAVRLLGRESNFALAFGQVLIRRNAELRASQLSYWGNRYV